LAGPGGRSPAADLAAGAPNPPAAWFAQKSPAPAGIALSGGFSGDPGGDQTTTVTA
jgi:hypothetical protein